MKHGQSEGFINLALLCNVPQINEKKDPLSDYGYYYLIILSMKRKNRGNYKFCFGKK